MSECMKMTSDDECEVIEIFCKKTPLSSVVFSEESKSTSQPQQFACPMCPYTSGEASVVEAHVENEHFNPAVTILKLSI